MEVVYSYNKRKNLVVFFHPEDIIISKNGVIILNEKDKSIMETRHLIHTGHSPYSIVLGYLDTIYIQNRIISQRFFPLSGVTAISKRANTTELKKGQSFEHLKVKIPDENITELRSEIDFNKLIDFIKNG